MSLAVEAAGWFRDPSGLHELRYWDGRAWTEHVADGGVVGVEPIPAPAEQVQQGQVSGGSGVIIDQLVKSGLRQKRLYVDLEQLVWGDERVLLNSVDAVAWTITHHSMNGVPTSTNYLFTLWRGNDQVKIGFNAVSVSSKAHKDGLTNLFEELVSASARLIQPRLREQILKQVARGEVVEVAGVRLSQQGIERPARLGSNKAVRWDRYAGARFQRGTIEVRATQDDGVTVKRVFAIAMGAPNAVLLPELLQQCAATLDRPSP